MKPNQNLRQTTLSEKIYGVMVHVYPFPFREAFGREMKQVFREQVRETAERSGKLGVLFLWLQVIADFIWTCPKEHFLALPSLPKPTWEHVLRKPVWIYPSVLAAAVLASIVIVTFSLTQVYSSSAEIQVKKQPDKGARTAEFDPYFLQTELSKIQSKAVLYQVISNLNLGDHYQKAYNLDIHLRPEEIYLYLTSSMMVNHRRNTELIEITVRDLDKLMAKKIANCIAEQYQVWKQTSARQMVFRQYGTSPEESPKPDEQAPPTFNAEQLQEFNADLASANSLVAIINPAEEGLRPVLPNRKLNIVVGVLISGSIGSISYFGLRMAKRNRQKNMATTAPLASA